VQKALVLAALGGLLMAAAVVGGSLARGQEETTSEREAQAVLRVVRRGRAAVLADKPKQVCRLLTRRARWEGTPTSTC